MCDMLSLPLGSLITALYTALRLRRNTFCCGVSSSSSSSNFGMCTLRLTLPPLMHFFLLLLSSSLLYASRSDPTRTLSSPSSSGPLSTFTSSFIFSLYLRLTRMLHTHCSTSSPSSSASTSFSSIRRYASPRTPPRTSHSSCSESRLLRYSLIVL